MKREFEHSQFSVCGSMTRNVCQSLSTFLFIGQCSGVKVKVRENPERESKRRDEKTEWTLHWTLVIADTKMTVQNGKIVTHYTHKHKQINCSSSIRESNNLKILQIFSNFNTKFSTFKTCKIPKFFWRYKNRILIFTSKNLQKNTKNLGKNTDKKSNICIYKANS